MKCRQCGAKTEVLESRDSPHGYRRRRRCTECGHRDTSYENWVLGVVASRSRSADPDAPDPYEVAQAVVDELEDRYGPRSDADELADAVVDRLLEEADARRGELTNGYRPELVAGDDGEDD